jgi:hypothetical protein
MPIMPDRHAKEQRILVREACTMHADRCRAIVLRCMRRELDRSMDVRPHLVRRNFPKKSGTWMPPTLVLRTPLHAPQHQCIIEPHSRCRFSPKCLDCIICAVRTRQRNCGSLLWCILYKRVCRARTNRTTSRVRVRFVFYVPGQYRGSLWAWPNRGTGEPFFLSLPFHYL